MTTRILVTGSRDWTDTTFIRNALLIARQFHPAGVLVHGDCRGADRIAADIWTEWGMQTEAHPADWDTHGKAAGPRRNRHMVQLGADRCLAFLLPGSRGSVHCADLAERAGIPTHRFHADQDASTAPNTTQEES